MRRGWSADELDEHWTLGAADLALLVGLPNAGKLGMAVQLAHWRAHGRFPNDEAGLRVGFTAAFATAAAREGTRPDRLAGQSRARAPTVRRAAPAARPAPSLSARPRQRCQALL